MKYSDYLKYVDVYRYDSKIYKQICFMAYEDCSNIPSIYIKLILFNKSIVKSESLSKFDISQS